MEELIQLDQNLFLYLNGLGNEAWDGFWLFMTEKVNQAPIAILLLYLFYRFFGLKSTLISLLVIAVLITVSDQLSNLFKNVLFLRPRPCQPHALGDVTRFIAERCGRHGYFSAHSSTTMGVAVFAGLVLRKNIKLALPLLIIWSLVVSYSRIYIGVHYPGDVVTGWFIGVLLGFGTYRLYEFLVSKYIATSDKI